MPIVVVPDIRADHGLVKGLVRDAFDGVDLSDVLVQVERARSPAQSFAGRAYPEPSDALLRGHRVRYLVRLFLPAVPRNRAYPKSYRYRRRKTAPWITVRDWHERLIALAAHEACHVRQFREGSRRSEVDAERWAERILGAWRTRTRVAPVPDGSEDARIDTGTPSQLAFAFI